MKDNELVADSVESLANRMVGKSEEPMVALMVDSKE